MPNLFFFLFTPQLDLTPASFFPSLCGLRCFSFMFPSSCDAKLGFPSPPPAILFLLYQTMLLCVESGSNCTRLGSIANKSCHPPCDAPSFRLRRRDSPQTCSCFTNNAVVCRIWLKLHTTWLYCASQGEIPRNRPRSTVSPKLWPTCGFTTKTSF